MVITFNGKPKEIQDGSTVGDILKELNYHVDMVTIELNGRLLGKEEYREAQLREGDVLKILHFMGGGELLEFCPRRT